jgi:hypothetical protein
MVKRASVRIGRFVASVVGVVWVRVVVIETGWHTEIRASKVLYILVLFSRRRIVEILITDETILSYNHVSASKWVSKKLEKFFLCLWWVPTSSCGHRRGEEDLSCNGLLTVGELRVNAAAAILLQQDEIEIPPISPYFKRIRSYKCMYKSLGHNIFKNRYRLNEDSQAEKVAN